MNVIMRNFVPGLLTALVLVCGFFWLREEVTSSIYRDKLAALAGDYAELADRYNHAVRQSAITELEVTEDGVAVIIRTIDGQIRRVPTPFDPRNEIFVDYVVANGRIWIRRVFDQKTPPEAAQVIDPVWETVDWEDAVMSHGKVVYRSLQPGIWSIQVSGNGALSLERAAASRTDQLLAGPAIRSYEEIRLELDQQLQDISMRDIWRWAMGGAD